MAIKNQILTTIQPRVPLREMAVPDLDSTAQGIQKSVAKETLFDSTGTQAPMVMINNLVLDANSIINMTLKQDGFLPKLTLTFFDAMGMFMSYQNPIFEPIVSIYVKSQSKRLKPLRGDYLITNIRTAPVQNDYQHMITLECELYVPGLYNNVSKSYPNMTSLDCLKKVAIELNLGFATNETQTSDKMTWLNPNLSYYIFMKDEVTKRAYKSDTSFFTCFIDRYYILNFVNVEKQMEQDKEFDTTVFAVDNIPSNNNIKGADDRELESNAPVYLSNHPLMKTNASHIREYWPISDNGEILKKNSFKRRVIWYEHETEQVNSFFIEPLSNKRTITGSVHQVPELTDLKSMEVKKWMGFDYGNAHAHNKFARVLNHHNSGELNKNQMCVRLDGLNSNIMRGTRVPVTFYNDAEDHAVKQVFRGKLNEMPDAKGGFYMDTFLSDIYYVKDVVYRYDIMNQSSPFTTELILSRRNWKKIKPE